MPNLVIYQIDQLAASLTPSATDTPPLRALLTAMRAKLIDTQAHVTELRQITTDMQVQQAAIRARLQWRQAHRKAA